MKHVSHNFISKGIIFSPKLIVFELYFAIPILQTAHIFAHNCKFCMEQHVTGIHTKPLNITHANFHI